MNVKELIEKLQQMPQELTVCIGDYLQNGYKATEDPADCGEGIYPDFQVELMQGDAVPEGSPSWVSLTFKNEDYED